MTPETGRLSRIRAWFEAPLFLDKELTRRARLLRTVLLGTVGVVTIVLVFACFLVPQGTARWLSIDIAVSSVSLILLEVNRRGHAQVASACWIVALTALVTIFAMTAGGIRAPATMGYVIVVLFAWVLLGERAGILSAGALALIALGLVYAGNVGVLLAPSVDPSGYVWWLALVMMMGLAVVALQLATGSIGESFQRARVELAERERVEAALRESETRFRALADASFEGIVLTEQGRCVDANDQVIQLLGASRDELMARPVMDFVAPQDRDVVRRAIESGASGPYEHLARRLDGTLFPAEVRARSMRLGERRLRVTAIRDATLRKQAEEERMRLEAQLAEAQKMEALGVLAGGVAHDFNNILTAIRGNAKLALEEIGGTSTAIHACLAEIEKAGARAAGLVRRILTFSRRQEPVKQVVELARVIEEALALLRAALAPNIAIRTEFAEALPPVAIDATQIHQIVMNLGTNAAHAMADTGGELLVSLDAFWLDERFREDDGLVELAEGCYVRVTFKDNGHGMDRATRERVFEPFFTTHPTTGGTGLGLSVVHGIVKSHEGAITVQSEPQKGTTFQIFLPQATSPGGHEHAPAPPAEPGQGEHLLYVDDDEALVFLATRVLTRCGYQVTGCIDPMQALEMFRANPREYDAVVTDLSMPRMSGSELAREMQRARPDVPIILTSGFIPPADKVREEFSGITAIILKPDTVDELARVLRQTLADAKNRS